MKPDCRGNTAVRLDRRPSQARQQQLLQLPVQRPELTLLLSPAVRRSYFSFFCFVDVGATLTEARTSLGVTGMLTELTLDDCES